MEILVQLHLLRRVKRRTQTHPPQVNRHPLVQSQTEAVRQHLFKADHKHQQVMAGELLHPQPMVYLQQVQPQVKL
jgi:hypothetical protein